MILLKEKRELEFLLYFSSATGSVFAGRKKRVGILVAVCWVFHFGFVAWMDPSSRQFQEMPNNNPKPRPQPEQALKCPRCDSTNTKFCYYNNYSLSQPRYFCKSCRRYWTKGGTLRNVPVGGGCRKNRRSSSSSKRNQDQPLITLTNTSLPLLGYDTTDLSLAFARLQKQPNVHLGFNDPMLGNPRSLSLFGNQNNFQGFYNYDQSLAGEVDNGGGNVGVSEEMMMMMLPYNNNNDDMNDNGAISTTSDVTVTTMKHELCNNGKESDNRSLLWGLPWQLSEDGHGNSYNMSETWSGVHLGMD